MFSGNGLKNIRLIVVSLLLLTGMGAMCQESILYTTYTFRAGNVKTGNALDLISRQAGVSFTYDSRLIDPEKKIVLDYRNTSLLEILRGILQNDSLEFSAIDKYIIISKPVRRTGLKGTLPDGRFYSITGKIMDEDTGDPLSYATVGFKSVPKGTVANIEGEFVLNIPPDLITDTLSVSFLGYLGREIPVDNAIGHDMEIAMRREYVSIPEIIIRNQIPQEILLKTRRAIPPNYGETPALMTGFYREGIMKKNELQTYSEAILRIYKSSYTATLVNDQIKVYKSRKIENVNRTDTLAIRLKAGLSTSLELDGIKNLFDFLSYENFKNYYYRLTDIVTYDDESVYVIDFHPREEETTPLFRGTIYINTTDFGIYKVEFEISPDRIDRMKEAFVSSATGGYVTWPVSVRYSVTYRKVEERYYLSHVRGDLLFNSRQKRRLFNSQFMVFFELAVTDIQLANVKRFERDELAPVHEVFSRTINTYDPEFWGDQDFLRPEENLMQALKDMRVRLQEFSEE